MKQRILMCLIVLSLSGCASGPPKVPYPAFMQVDTLDDVFMASLPGVRAKQLAGDPQTRRTSNRIDLPRDWKGTSGGAPGRSMEIFVLAGELTIADIVLQRGGYAFLPAGSLGFNLSTADGARILYFVNDTDPQAVIRSPIIIDSGLIDWQDTDAVGVTTKELRADPGSGAKTWLLRVATGAGMDWESSTAVREGYLIGGNQQYVECVNGEPMQWQYAPGGYFYRPENTINGGPDSLALQESTWFVRETASGQHVEWPGCMVQDTREMP
ncbi:MAG: DUF4437 domain-containing protein [Gammaproteobacteria bacterium]|nr:DUF4437 domain-containing protein [Gammaproteobacteria bacterium]